MSTPSEHGGQQGTIKSLVEEALVLLNLAEVKIPVQKQNLKPKATQAKESVETLLSALQNGENIAVSIYEGELEQIRTEVINWNSYRR